MIKHCIAIHDLCSYSKSSLSVIIPVLEALGVEVWPLPTALLSTQTDGFDNLYMKDLSEQLNEILSVWERENIKANCIYSGFLAGADQVDLVKRVIKFQKCNNKPLIVVDPVLGDDLKLYSTVDNSHVEAMRDLVSYADIICPNATEAAILLGISPRKYYNDEEVRSMLISLSKLGPNKVVITSVYQKNSNQIKTCFFENGEIGEYCIDRVNYTYPGSGDLFASVMIGSLLNGRSLAYSCIYATDICLKSMKETKKLNYSRKHGVSIASIISELSKLINFT